MNIPENEKTNLTEDNNIIGACEEAKAETGEVEGEIKEVENQPETSDAKVPDDTNDEASEIVKEKKASKKTLKLLYILLPIVLALILAVVVCIVIFGAKKPFENVISEAGEVPTPEMFFEGDVPQGAVFTPALSEISKDIPGKYNVDITVGKKTYTSVLSIEDTVAPMLTARENVTIWSTALPEPSAFIAETDDKTEVTLVWAAAPTLEAEGDYTGKIKATDLGGNETELDVTFALMFDRQTPAFEGVKDIEAFIGNAQPDYMEGVGATDDKTENVIIEVDSSAVDTTTGGKYTVIYKAYDLAGNVTEATATVTVVEDKTAPVIAGAVNCNIIPGTEFDVLSYIKVTDNWDKNVNIEITENIDNNTYGQYPVEVRASDFSGNVSEARFTVNVGVDTVAPVIVPTDIWVYEGDTVSYRKTVTVMDNFYPAPKLTVDSSSVNLNVIGNYTVKYTVTDASGNTSSAQAPVYVIKRPSIQELTNDMADKVLSQITNDSMTMLEKIYAVYKWVNKNVRYIGTSDKSSYIAGAYEGLSTGKGDCYTYYAVARVFLDRLGVANIEMKRTGTKDRHFWNLVNLGNGWYHYDCSYFNTGNGNLFMVTDSEAFAWDDLHFKGEHRFDYSPECPERATESMQYVVDYKARKIVQEVQTPALSEPLAQ